MQYRLLPQQRAMLSEGHPGLHVRWTWICRRMLRTLPVRRRLRQLHPVFLNNNWRTHGSSGLYALLFVSIFTNVLLLGKLYYSRVLNGVVIAMQAPPVVTPSDHIRGNRDAPATVIVFTDYDCPFCARLHATLLTVLKDTKARVVYRHFPLESHPLAGLAAESAECAGAQGKFWEYSDSLFAPKAEDRDSSSFPRIAVALGLNRITFEECLSSRRFQSRVLEQQRDGVKRRISGTPTFFINGKRYDGLAPQDQIRLALGSN